MKCLFASTGQHKGAGLREHRCLRCGFVRWSTYAPELIHRECSETTVAEQIDYAQILPAEDRALLGDNIAALLSAIGIPPCSGCEARKVWLNNAHRWLCGLWS